MSAIDDLLNSANEKRSTAAGPQGFYDAAVQQQRPQQGGTAVDQLLNAHGGSFVTGQRTDMSGTYRNWYSGQNLQGTGNGWDTDFQRTFQAGAQRAYEQGRQLEYFTQDNATGVVTWDNAAGRGGTKYAFGDVIVEGKKVGNVYEDFDRHTANVMMGDYLIETGARKRELNEDRDAKKAWDNELRRLRTEANRKAEAAPRAAAFEEAVEDRVTDNEDSREKIAFTAGAGGSALGAGVGSLILPGIGTAIGAGVGFGVSYLGAWLNSDSLQYQVARSREQYAYASKEGAGIQAAMSGIAQNTMSIALSPFNNLLQGSYDQIYGEGPGKGAIGGAFQETNDEGERKAGGAWQAAEFGAMIGDSLLQFASPAGRLAYQAQMSTQIGAGLYGLLPGVGQWDARLVRQDNVWTRDEYNPETGQWEQKFDAGNAFAGIGSVAIDAVQLGAVSSLGRSTDRLSAQFTAQTGIKVPWARTYKGESFLGLPSLSKLNLSPEQRAAIKAGAQIETRSGYKFVVKDSGEIVGKARTTMAMLAPSEGLNALTAKMLVRRDAARREGAITAEQLYQTASDLALGQRGLTAMLVNAVGEGQEEALQAILEPMSQDHKVNAEEVLRAGFAGAASGFGMTWGNRLGMPSQDQRMYAIGQAAWAAQRGGEELSYEQWQGMDHLQKRTLVKSASALAESLVNAGYEKIEHDRIATTIGGVVEAAAVEDYWRAETEAQLKTGADATDQAAPIVMHESYTFRADALATSHNQLLQNQQDRSRGAKTQLEKLGKAIVEVTSEYGMTPTEQHVANRLATMRSDHAALSEVVAASETLERTLRRYVERIDAAFGAQTPDGMMLAEDTIDELNDTLEAMFDMTDNTYELVMPDGNQKTVTLTDADQLAFSKAVSRLATRDPADSTGSWQVMVPQVHKVFAFRGADGLYAVSQIILKAIRGDYDGDKMRQLQQVVVDDERYRQLRSGANILGAEALPEIGSTKFEAQIATRIMQAWGSSNTTLRDAARQVAATIESQLKLRYHNTALGITPVPREVIDEVREAVDKALESGKDVRETVLDLMSRRAGNALTEIGRGDYWRPGMPKLSNEYYWMANMVTQAMQEFQWAYAEYTPTKGSLLPERAAVSPSRTSTDARVGRLRRGATAGTTSINELPGSNMFRMFQKKHYTLWETTDKYAGFPESAPHDHYREIIEHYEQLSQGVTEQRLDRLPPSQRIIGQVLEWLEQSAADPDELRALGLSEMGDMALMANVLVPQMTYENDDNGVRRLRYTGKQVSLGQHLLYLSLEKFKRENSQVWDKDADLKATYNNLRPLTIPQTQGDTDSHKGNAEMAFVKIFEEVRLYDIVGVDALSLGVMRTVGQVYRDLVNLSVEERAEQKYRAREGAYRDAEKGMSIPYGPDVIRAGSVNTYKSLVDSLFSAADSSISQNRSGKNKGKVVGRFAKKSNERGKAIRDTYTAVQQLLQQLEPRKSYTADDITRLANERREFGDALMKAIPRSAMPWVVRRQEEDGRFVFASWFYEVWTQPTAEQAEMSYFRNLVLNSWYAKKRTLDVDRALAGDGVEKKITFDSLDSRMHRVLFRLAANSAIDPFRMNAFMAKLNSSDTVEEFMEYVNTEDGLVEGAPMLAWMDDVAEFDPERAGGGWAASLSTPALMENINNLRATAQRMVKDIDASRKRSAKDIQTALVIQKVYKHLKNPSDQSIAIDPAEMDIYNRFVALLEASAKRRVTNGPRAMLQHTAHLVYGMYATAHAKGEIPDQMAANAALEAMDDGIGFLTTAERVLGELTAHNEDAVAQSPHMLLRDGGRMMDRYGSQVEWELNSVEAMLPLMLEEKHHHLMRAVLFDTVVELDTDNVARRKFLMGSTLDEVLTGNTVKDLFNDDGAPNLTQAMKYLVKLEQELRDVQKHQIEQKVTEWVLARTTSLDQEASFEEIQELTVQAYLDLAETLQVIGRTEAEPGKEDPVHAAHRKAKEAAMVSTLSAVYNVDPKIVNGSLSNLQDVVKQELLKVHNDRIAALIKQQAQSGLTATERGELEATLKAEKSVRKAMAAKIDRMFDLNVTDQIVEQYLYSSEADEAFKHARQTDLMQYVYEHGELVEAAGPAMVTVQMIKNYLGETADAQRMQDFVLPEKAWEELSSVIISVEIQRLIGTTSASKPPPPYPAPLKPGVKGLDKRKYWDYSFSYMFDFMAEDAEDGILQAARDLAVKGGKVGRTYGEAEVLDVIKNRVMREDTLGQWTRDIPIQSIESWDLLTGASSKPAISMFGLLSQRWGATMAATRRQTEDTVADATVTFTSFDLNWMDNGQFHDVTVLNETNGKPYARPLAALNNRFAEELSFTYVDDTGVRSTPVDLMSRKNLARTWFPAAANSPIPATRFKEVNITRLREELELVLKERHPGASRDQLTAMLDSAETTMKFVNPDSQPATIDKDDVAAQEQMAKHANSVWHEGTVYYSDGDMGDSLITAFFFGVAGQNARGQQAALDTRKLGLMGIEDYQHPGYGKVRDLEDRAGTDFAGMLNEKTKILMDTPISDGKPIDVHFWNGAYKLMKLKHWVEGIQDGEKVRWSAEQVIAWQMQNPGKDLFKDQDSPLREARLWIPSDQVLADMMGDIGFGGVKGRGLKREITEDLTTIPRYESRWSEKMEQNFSIADSQPKAITDTDVSAQSYVQDVRVSSYVTPQERTRFRRRAEAMLYKRARALEARVKDAQRPTFDPAVNREKNMGLAVGWVANNDVNVHLSGQFQYLSREHGNVLERTLMDLQQYTDALQAELGQLGSSFWIYQEDGRTAAEEGRLTKHDLTGKLTIVPGEVVFFDTAPYQHMDPTKARELALERIEFFVNRGAALMIESSDGPVALTGELRTIVQQQHRYQRYENNTAILRPDVFDESTFQNVAAARSQLVVPSAVEISRQRLSMLLFDQQVEENTMWIPVRPGRRTKFDAIQTVFDLFPVDVHSQFNTANTREDAENVHRWLQGLGPEGKEMLRQEATRHLYKEDNPTKLRDGVTQAEVDAAETDFNEAFDRLMLAMPKRVQANTTQPLVGETFQTGDLVPLISANNELLLYRHGYTYPKKQDFQRQLRNQTRGASGNRGIVMYSGKREKAATTHKGTVTEVKPFYGRGLRIEMEIPVQYLGEKIVFEHNGMKYLQTTLPSNIVIPEVPLFGDVEIDGFASLLDSNSKEAWDGYVVNFQEAFAVFGIDFREDIQKFFGTDTISEAVSILRKIARYGEKRSVEEIYQFQSLTSGQDAYFSAIAGLLPQLMLSEADTTKWTTKLQDTTPEAYIARAMILYLMSPGADVDAVLWSSGFHVDNPSLPGAQSQKMPELFTRAFDLAAPDSSIKAELSRRINEGQLNRNSETGWYLDVNSWELEGRTRDGRTLRGLLQYGEAHASEDNPLLNLMAQERKVSQSATRHQALMNMIGTGGVTRTNKKKRLDRFTKIRQQDLTDPDEIGSFWRDLTFVDPSTYGPGSRWQTRTPMELRYYNRSIERYKQYRHAIDLDDAVFDDVREKITNDIKSIRHLLKLRPSQEELIHYWIRQVLYHPVEGRDQDAFSEDLAPNDVLGATKTILGNLDRGYLPTYDGAGPGFFSYHDLEVLFQANQRDKRGWAPWRKEGDPTSKASKDNLGEWIAIAFGQAINSGVDFDPIYRLDMSGFMNTYQSVLRASGFMMDIALDKELQGKLLDPQTNELVTVAVDPVENTRLTEQVLLATSNLSYEDLMSGATGGDSIGARRNAAAWRARRLQARARWRARHAVRPVKVQSSRDFLRNGTELINRDADMHSLQRIVIALRHGTAMLNPGLYFSMIPEQGFRMMLSEITNALSGESTLRSVTGVQRGVERAASAVTGGRLNFQIGTYSADQVRELNELFTTLGNDGTFTSLIMRELMWKKEGGSPGRAVDLAEKYASIGNKWQDPTWGTTQKSLARHYVEAIMRSIESMPTRNVMTIDSVIAALRTDPAYFAKNMPELHQMASNYVVDFRSLKNTPASLAFKAIYEPASRSSNMLVRFGGTLLKLQAMYATYNMNVLTTITGMQGYSDMVAVFLEGRRKPNSFLKMWWKGRNEEPITDEDYRTFDLSTVIDGTNIANAFIRGGVTQTGLFMLGMAAGGILSGEDEEAKRRRRLAEAQNVHLIMDPRRLETDFRNKEVLFLDWLPPQLSAISTFFRVQPDDGVQGTRSAAQISWVLKPFLSPILGMERFFMTGDFGYVTHGFMDAIGSLPLFNKSKWDDVSRTADELVALAAEEQEAATPASLKNTMYLLSSVVAMYESMLVENMFVNSFYTGLDMYDRDPTRLVLRDSDGVPQVDIENNPRPNDIAFSEFVDENGDVDQGYKKRNAFSANLAAYTENNFTAAAMMSLFTGFRQDYMRSQMPVRMRTIDMPELSEQEAKVAVVLATLNQQRQQGQLERRLSLDEVTTLIRTQAIERKDWDTFNNLDAIAMQFYQSDANPQYDAMSVIGPDGQEVLTKSGASALFKGLMGGTISLDDPEMRGIAITPEMRKELEKDFYVDMTREGQDLGLTVSQAKKRATRLMLGPLDDPSILGFRDILWDERIPWTADPKYKQLNTTYTMGPDGFPWATGYKRGGAPGMGGFWQLFGGLKRPTTASSMSDAMTEGGRMNSADLVRGINTGQRGLVPMHESELIPTDWEQTQTIIDALEDFDSNAQSYIPNSRDTGGGSGSFYRRGYSRGYGGYGGGGGYSSRGYSPTIYWSRQPSLPRGTNVYGNSARNLFWKNANIRRTTIRRERYQSARGRLNQWQ